VTPKHKVLQTWQDRAAQAEEQIAEIEADVAEAQ